MRNRYGRSQCRRASSSSASSLQPLLRPSNIPTEIIIPRGQATQILCPAEVPVGPAQVQQPLQPVIDVQQFQENVISQPINSMTDADLLFTGLSFVGFDRARQAQSGQARNFERFSAHFGWEPKVINFLFTDLVSIFPKMDLKDGLMTLNWFKGYDTRPVLAGRWDSCEEYIGPKVKEYAKMIQSLKAKKNRFGEFDPNEIHIITVDGVHFVTNEFRLDPSGKWYDHKRNCAGLTYEFAMSIRKQQIVSVRGPEPAATADITVFRGGKVATKVEDRDQEARFSRFQKANLLLATLVTKENRKRLFALMTIMTRHSRASWEGPRTDKRPFIHDYGHVKFYLTGFVMGPEHKREWTSIRHALMPSVS